MTTFEKVDYNRIDNLFENIVTGLKNRQRKGGEAPELDDLEMVYDAFTAFCNKHVEK